MTRQARELETLLLTMFAAVPLYLTYAIGKAPLIAFHAIMALIALRVAIGKGPELLPGRLMRWLAMAYVPFYFVDWIGISHSAIAASTHLVLFIAIYQPIESLQRDNQAQRMLTTALIFVASIATSTHITIVAFILAFAFLMLRQLMYVSHLQSVASVSRDYQEPASGRAALLYVAGAALIGMLLFPFLPRVRNPIVQGVATGLAGSSTALSDTIDFDEPRSTPSDNTVVARIWMDDQTRPFFSPVRLRGTLYDYYDGGEWRQTLRGLRPVTQREGAFILAKPRGIDRTALVQHRPSQGKLFLPVGTYAVSGLSNIYEGAARDTYHTYSRGMLNLEVRMAQQAEPLRLARVELTGYPVTPEVAALARQIVGSEQSTLRRAQMIENYMVRNFRYVPNPATLGTLSVEQFLLRTRAGHCEYFAAGMVVLLTSLEIPARIAGGFYGGRLNPITGYYTVQRADAHAWTEVWDGTRWQTYDSTPPSLRPGSQTQSSWRAYVAAIADSINYFWDRYILTFGLADQIQLFQDLLELAREKVPAWRESLSRNVAAVRSRGFGVTMATLLLAGIAAIFFVRRRRTLFDAIARQLRARGVEVTETMTVEEALRELRRHDPAAADKLAPVIALYEEEEFAGRPDRARRAEIRRALSS